MTRVTVLGGRFLTTLWVERHPKIVVSVGHIAFPREKDKPFTLLISPGGRYWEHRGVLKFVEESEMDWDTAVSHCADLYRLGVRLECFRMHGSPIKSEALHDAINKHEIADAVEAGAP